MTHLSPSIESPSKGWRERVAALSRVPSFLQIVWETSRPLSILAISLRLIAAFVPIASLLVGKHIINLVVHAIQHHHVNMRTLWTLLAAGLFLTIVADVFSRLIALVDSLLGDLVAHSITIRMMKQATQIDLELFEDPAFHDKIERARKQMTGRLSLLTSVAGIVRQLVTLATMMITVVILSPWVLALLLIATIPVLLGETQYVRLQYSMLFRQTSLRREINYLQLLSLESHSAKEIKLYGLGDYLVERTSRLFHHSYQENRELAAAHTVRSIIVNLIPTLTYWITYSLVVIRALSMEVTVGDIALIAGAFSRARNIIANLVNQTTEISEQALFLEDLFEFLETVPAVRSDASALRAPRPIQNGYEFRNVSFSYKGNSIPVLDNISFCIRPGEKIAIVGDNGAGKTTLIKLMMRFYDPTKGTILLDGKDIRDYDITDLRKEMAVMFQDYVQYEMLASDNIGLGELDELNNEGRIRAAAEKSRASKVVEKLPNRYQQMLGQRFKENVNLSTGQWQKIALARAYMRNAQLLILDEPTSSLDTKTELELFYNVLDLADINRMTVLISHRFSTVRKADRILVLENGCIVEMGSHEHLLAIGGKYAELFQLQAAAYS